MSIKNTLSEKFSLIVYRTGQLSLRARLAMAGAIQNKPLINEMIKKTRPSLIPLLPESMTFECAP